MINIFIPLILVALAAILSVVLFRAIKEKNNNLDNGDSWEAAYKKASDFIGKLNRTERVNLLFGTQNMKMETLLFVESEAPYTCVGQIDPFKN